MYTVVIDRNKITSAQTQFEEAFQPFVTEEIRVRPSYRREQGHGDFAAP